MLLSAVLVRFRPRRLVLASLIASAKNLLVLDEPTNHLDIPAREALESFLKESSATVIVVSHDRRFLETICDRLWVVDAGLAVPFEGGYRAWREAVAGGWTTSAAAAAERFGWTWVIQSRREAEGDETPSTWLMMTASSQAAATAGLRAGDWTRPLVPKGVEPWTDDWANLLIRLKILSPLLGTSFAD